MSIARSEIEASLSLFGPTPSGVDPLLDVHAMLHKMWFPLQCPRPALVARQFHSTSRVLARRDVAKRMPLPRDLVDFDIEQDFPEFSGNDIPSGAHIALHQQRQLAYYMRLIENEMPKFVGKSHEFMHIENMSSALQPFVNPLFHLVQVHL